MPDLKIAPCDHKTATYAVEKWHYSKRMPVGRLIKYGVWEDGTFIGAVVFGRGASPFLGAQYNLDQTQVCELVRVALHRHQNTVTKIVAIAIRLLRKSNPGLRLIVSFADPGQGHVGTIYQAGNWLFTGMSPPSKQYWHEGRWKHPREATGGAFQRVAKIKDYQSLPTKIVPGKYRYLMPLDNEMASQVAPLRKSFPIASLV